MMKQALMDEIRRLSIEEQIELLGDVWDEIADSEAVPVPEWHLREIERRLAEPEPEYVPWDEVRRRLKGDPDA
ncbi:hypothetical protein BH20GEM1_BH20GEM1_00740 [soil metagenome]